MAPNVYQIMATMVLPTSTRIQFMLYTFLKVFVHTETFMSTYCLILTHFTRSCNEGKYNLGTQQHKKITFGKLNNYIASFYKHAKNLGAKIVDIYFRGNISISIKLFGIIIGLASNSCQLIIVHSVQRAIWVQGVGLGLSVRWCVVSLTWWVICKQ